MLYWAYRKRQVKSMEKQRNYRKEDRHRNSKNCGVRVDNTLFELFKNKATKEGKSMRSILIKAIEDYVFNDEN